MEGGWLRVRFGVWVAVVVALLGGQVIWLGEGAPWLWAGVGVGEVMVGGMVALLWTTPVGAIRLGRGVSETVVFGGTVALLTAGGAGGGGRVVLAAICGGMLVGLRRAGRSPWWAAVVAWNPLVVALAAGRVS